MCHQLIFRRLSNAFTFTTFSCYMKYYLINFSDFLFNTKAFVLQAHDEQDKENEGKTGKVKYWIN